MSDTRLSFYRFVLVLTLLAIFIIALQGAIDADTWWHLRAGKCILENRKILTTDPFSLTRQGDPWLYPGWLSQIVIYSIYAHAGLVGLNLLTAFAVTLAFSLIWFSLHSAPLLRSLTILLAAMVSGIFWSARPQIFSLVLTAFFVLILERSRNGNGRLLWVLPILMILWGNLHGGFAIGGMLLIVYLLGEVIDIIFTRPLSSGDLRRRWRDRFPMIRSYLLVGLTCIPALTINPQGPAMLLYPFKTIGIEALRDYIVEWQSPDFHLLEMQPFLVMLSLIGVSFAFSTRKPLATELIIVFGFGYLGFIAARNIPIFAVAAAPVLNHYAESAIRPLLRAKHNYRQLPEKAARWINLVILIIAGLGGFILRAPFLSEYEMEKKMHSQFPIDAVDIIQDTHPQGPLFNSYNWGGYIIWRLYPDYLSFVDGRTDLFGDEILDDYLSIWRAEPGWQSSINRWGIRLFIIESNAPLARELERSGWLALYRDEMAVVYGSN